MASNVVRTLGRIVGPNVTRPHILNSAIPSTCHVLHVNGNPSASFQQYRTKKKYVEYKFNKPINFDHSGDTAGVPTLVKDDLLFKYRDIPEIEQLPDEQKKLFTIEYASAREKLAHRHMLMQERMTKEVGPAQDLEKQIAYLTVKIRNIMPKLQKIRANKRQKVHVMERIDKRNKFLGYLRMLDFKRYEWIQHELGLTYKPYDKFKYIRPTKKSMRKQQARQDAYKALNENLEKCREVFAAELKEVRQQKEEIFKEIKEYDLDVDKIVETLEKDLREKHKKPPKMSPKFREFEEEKKRKKLEEYYVV